MHLVEVKDYPFNRVNINWHGPFPWTKNMGGLLLNNGLAAFPGIYRAETLGRARGIIKYIGSASENFGGRLTSQHRIKHDLVDGNFRRVYVYLGIIEVERRIELSRSNYRELEYILQNVHWQELISWHGLSRLPRTARGEGWHIVNMGKRGSLKRVIAYPAFAVSGQDR